MEPLKFSQIPERSLPPFFHLPSRRSSAPPPPPRIPAHRPPAPLVWASTDLPAPPGPTPFLCWRVLPSPRRAAEPPPLLLDFSERSAAVSLARRLPAAPRVTHEVPQPLHRLLLAYHPCATPPSKIPCAPPHRPPWRRQRHCQFAFLS